MEPPLQLRATLPGGHAVDAESQFGDRYNAHENAVLIN
jgi:hypothetical protein